MGSWHINGCQGQDLPPPFSIYFWVPSKLPMRTAGNVIWKELSAVQFSGVITVMSFITSFPCTYANYSSPCHIHSTVISVCKNNFLASITSTNKQECVLLKEWRPLYLASSVRHKMSFAMQFHRTGKFQPFSKIAVAFEPVMQFWIHLIFIIPLFYAL